MVEFCYGYHIHVSSVKQKHIKQHSGQVYYVSWSTWSIKQHLTLRSADDLDWNVTLQKSSFLIGLVFCSSHLFNYCSAPFSAPDLQSSSDEVKGALSLSEMRDGTYFGDSKILNSCANMHPLLVHTSLQGPKTTERTHTSLWWIPLICMLSCHLFLCLLWWLLWIPWILQTIQCPVSSVEMYCPVW